jgi:CPA1 family monovalent cation:H+ antiporter
MAAEAAIRALEKAHHQMAKGRRDADCYAEAASDLMADYRDRIDWESPGEERHNRKQLKQSIDRRLRAEAMKAERETIFFLARTRQIDDQLARKLVSEVDLNEARDLPFWESESPTA